MSITEELKTWVDAYPWRKNHDAAEAHALIDRVDVAHQREMDEARDVALALANHRVTLPYDANGVPINLGDEVYNVDDGPEAHFTVEYLMLDEDGWTLMGEMTEKPSNLRHWEAPSIENLLNEFANRIDKSGHLWGLDADETVAEYAERIREAIEHEEDK